MVWSYTEVVCFLSRFYAGGSERSGQQIVGPPRKKSPNELVEDLFKGAKEHGAVAVDRTAKSSGESSKPKVRSVEFFLLFSPSLLELSVCGSHWDSFLVLWGTKTILKEHLSLDSSISAALFYVSRWQEKLLCAIFINLSKLVNVPEGQQMLLMFEVLCFPSE